MLDAATLAAIVTPLLLLVAVIARHIAQGMDDALESTGPAAPVLDLAQSRVSRTQAPTYPSLPVGFRYDAVTPGPLQLVDDEGPSTKVCPDCTEAVLHSARVCKHCGHHFGSPLSGSHAV